MLRSPQDLFSYQREIVQHICEHERSMVWARVGSGKTAATATAVYTLQQWGYIRAALIFGTRRIVQQVWGPECAKWSHLRHMRVAVLRGKHREYLLQQQADLYVINYEAIPWLITQLHHTYFRHNRPLPFDMVILDEVTRVKNAQGKRWGYLYEGLMPAIPRRVGLTGTPAPNGYLDLHGQYRMLDDGQRLGTSKEHYRDHFFRQDGYGGYKYVPRTNAKDQIHNLIGDITAHVHVPRRTAEPVINDIMVQLEPQHRKQYEDLEKELFAELDGGEKLEVFNQAALSNKCLQLANGSAITDTETRQWAPVHDAKLEALDDLLEEIGGRPLLLAYNFRSDMHRIVERYRGKLAVAYLGPGVSDADGVDIENRWNNGEYNLLVGHPDCLGAETEVLSENRGWIRIADVLSWERVHDGVEFVSHAGCHYAGCKETAEVFGVVMTPNHKLLVGGEWVEAKNVGTDRRTRRLARIAKWETEASSPSEVCPLWCGTETIETEFQQAQPKGRRSLRGLYSRYLPSHDRNPILPDMARTSQPSQRQHGLRKLRWPWDLGVQTVAHIRELLRRYVSGVLGRSDDRTYRQQQVLRTEELSLGHQYGAASQQAQQSTYRVPRKENPPGRVGSPERLWQMYVDAKAEQRDDRRRGSAELSGVDLRSGEGSFRKVCPVFDLVNCGPRHRFLIRNTEGEVFISHNSIGHGLNLQYGGHEICWFGLTWNLELYDQFIGRLDDRHGQTEQVIVHRILADDTIDLVVRAALRDKIHDQEGLKHAITEYRNRKRAGNMT